MRFFAACFLFHLIYEQHQWFRCFWTFFFFAVVSHQSRLLLLRKSPNRKYPLLHWKPFFTSFLHVSSAATRDIAKINFPVTHRTRPMFMLFTQKIMNYSVWQQMQMWFGFGIETFSLLTMLVTRYGMEKKTLFMFLLQKKKNVCSIGVRKQLIAIVSHWPAFAKPAKNS